MSTLRSMSLRGTTPVTSLDNFTCKNFKDFFEDNKRTGIITTLNNDRRYHVVWDKSTDTISVKRNLAGVDRWTRISEVLERWSHLDFTTNAEKWQNRLTIQKHNVALAQPVTKTINKLRQQIENTNPRAETFRHHDKTISTKIITGTSALFTRFFQQKKEELHKKVDQLHSDINENLVSNQYWTEQENVKNSAVILQKQIERLDYLIQFIPATLILYYDAASSINKSTKLRLYNAVLKRLDSFAINLQHMIDSYLNVQQEDMLKTEINRQDNQLKNEYDILSKIKKGGWDAGLCNNILLNFKKDELPFNYQELTDACFNTLVDSKKTLDDIINAEDKRLLDINKELYRGNSDY